MNEQSDFGIADLPQAFAMTAARGRAVEHLRIFAISSSLIRTLVIESKLDIENCSLLVQRKGVANEQFSRETETVIERWRALVRVGSIRRLEVARYDFHPTEYECIFDTDAAIVGLYEPSDADISGVVARDPLVVRAGSATATTLIKTYVDRYDVLFDACRRAS